MISCSFVFNYFSFFSTGAIQDNFKLSCFLAFNMQLKGIIGVFCFMFIFYLFVYFLTLKDIIVPVETKLFQMYKCF